MWVAESQAAGTEKNYKHSRSLSPAIADIVKPVYQRLSERSLLERCARGATQNSNEALNKMIRQMCPKTSFCSSETVSTSVYLAIIIWNDGYSKLEAVLEHMACEVGSYTSVELKRLDVLRAKNRKRKSSSEEKASRKKRRAKRKGFEDEAAEKEGTTYMSGGF